MQTNNPKEYIHRHKDGTVWAKGKVVNGKKDGYWEWFRKDGTRMRSGYFRVDKQSGEWTTYRQDGSIVKVTNFDKK